MFQAFICSHHNRSVNLILSLPLNGVRTSWNRHYSCKHLHDKLEKVGVNLSSNGSLCILDATSKPLV